MAVFSEIADLLHSLSVLSGIGICFYDIERFYQFSSPQNRPYIGHYCEFCRSARLLSGGRAACDKSDRLRAMTYAAQYRAPFLFSCHMGMRELVVPICAEDDALRGLVFLGQCRIAGKEDGDRVAAAAAAMGGDGARFRALYDALPIITEERLWAMGKVVSLYFRPITALSRALPERPEARVLGQGTLGSRVAAYIEVHYMQDISPAAISRAFFISPAYLARAFRAERGCTVGEYLRTVRLQNAERMLLGSTLPVGTVAQNVGYSDYNYFSRLFRERYGCSPAVYRKQKRKDETI